MSQNLLQESIEKDIAWAIAGGLPDKEKRMPLLGSGPSFQEQSSIENMQKSKINYFPTIPKSPEYPPCKTYLSFWKFWNFRIYSYTQMNRCTPDFTNNMEAQISLFKSNSYYGWFSSVVCFAESFFETLQLFGFTR